jgi:NitT/TauT family transport system permease protein
MKLRADSPATDTFGRETADAAVASTLSGDRAIRNPQSKIRNIVAPVLTLAIIIGVWELGSYLRTQGLVEGTLEYRQAQSVLPYAHRVFFAYFEIPSTFFNAGIVTLWNAFVGFLIGGALGYALALVMSRTVWVARSFYIYIIGSQMIPIIALAPILYGIIKDETVLKITVAAYLTFFPVTVNVLKGLQSVEPRALELLHSYAASNREIYTKLRIPASMPFLFVALKIAATGSLIGAIVSELMGGSAGIGVQMIQLQYSSFARSDLMWALVLEAALIGVLFFGAVTLAERIFVPWQPEFRRVNKSGG